MHAYSKKSKCTEKYEVKRYSPSPYSSFSQVNSFLCIFLKTYAYVWIYTLKFKGIIVATMLAGFTIVISPTGFYISFDT